MGQRLDQQGLECGDAWSGGSCPLGGQGAVQTFIES